MMQRRREAKAVWPCPTKKEVVIPGECLSITEEGVIAKREMTKRSYTDHSKTKCKKNASPSLIKNQARLFKGITGPGNNTYFWRHIKA